MKRIFTIYTPKTAMLLLLFTVLFGASAVNAQFSTGADVVSRYVWRGQLLASGLVIQPSLSYTTSFDSSGNYGLTVGAWGSYGISSNDGTEADVYLSFTASNFSAMITDYFFPSDVQFSSVTASDNYFQYGDKVIEGDTTSTGHVYEAGLSFNGTSKIPVSVALYKNIGGADNLKSMYLNLGYSVNNNLSLAVGAGDGWYTTDGDIALTNVSMTYTKMINKLSAYGTFSVNPELEKIFLVFGVSF